MADNVTHLPRAVRPVPEPGGLYIRVGRNDHKALLNLLSAVDLGCFGVVIDAVQVERDHLPQCRCDELSGMGIVELLPV
jgi:hypothetical protein